MADPPPGVQHDYPLARLTTIRTGGPAELFARPGSLPELERLLGNRLNHRGVLVPVLLPVHLRIRDRARPASNRGITASMVRGCKTAFPEMH